MTARIESFELGRTATLERHVALSDVDNFIQVSGDRSSIHEDELAAKSKGFDGRVAHGLLLGAYVSALIGVELPGNDGVLQSINLQFRSPLVPPADIVISAKITGISIGVSQVRILVRVTSKDQKTLFATAEVRCVIR